MLELKHRCDLCGKEFAAVYTNKGSYISNGQKYNHQAPAANFNRHVAACKKKHGIKPYAINKTCIMCGEPITQCPYYQNEKGGAYHSECLIK